MRRTLLAFLAVALIAVAGCGDKGGSGPGAKSPLDEALGFLPKDAPFALAIDTNADGDQWKQVDKLLGKFPLVGGQAKQSLKDQLKNSGVDFDKDIKPILGNDAVVGSPSVQKGNSDHFVAAIQAEDEGKLDKIIDKQGVKQVGEKDGFKLYEDTDDGDFAARRDAVVVFADTREVLEAAVEQRGKDDRLREDDFEKGLDGLPEDALVRVYGDLQTLLAESPEAATARKVPWVAALRSFGVTLAAEKDGVGVNFQVKTDPSELKPEDLPLASGEPAPPVAGNDNEFLLGIRDPSQIVEFAQRTAQVVDPSGYRDFEVAKRTIGSKLGVDLDRDLIGQLSGNAQVAIAADGTFAVRADLQDPAAFEATLKKTVEVLPSALEGAGLGKVTIAAPKGGEQFYAVAFESGKTAVYGVVNDKFVLSNKPERAAAMAGAATKTVPGGKGAMVFFADARELVGAALAMQGEGAQLGSLFTGALRDLTGSVQADTTGVRGFFKIGIE